MFIKSLIIYQCFHLIGNGHPLCSVPQTPPTLSPNIAMRSRTDSVYRRCLICYSPGLTLNTQNYIIYPFGTSMQRTITTDLLPVIGNEARLENII